MSLGAWFRDYVYIPLGGNRVGKLRWFFNIFVVWMLTGFWHGAGWQFIVWGLMYAVLLIAEKLFLKKMLEHLPAIVRYIYVMFFVVTGFVIFNAEGMGSAVSDLAAMLVKPMMAFIGVRMSWDILFRKVVFARLAFWAVRTASSISQ